MKKIVVISLLTGFLTYSYADWLSFLDKSTYDKAHEAFINSNDKDAAFLYEKSCIEGDYKGCYHTGYMYQYGRGVETNLPEAIKFYNKACQGGYSKACHKSPSLQKQISEKEQINSRIASYESKYLAEHNRIVSTKPKMLTTYIQPANKKEACKLYKEYTEGDKYFEKDESYKIYWDGSCKDGYASGLGREIEKADMVDKWALAIYTKGHPTYYIVNNILHQRLIEGVYEPAKEDDIFRVTTSIDEKNNDIDMHISAGVINKKTGINLLYTSSSFWNETYVLSKEYRSFSYIYANRENNDDPLSEMNFEFKLQDQNGINNGWTLAKDKQGNFFTGEFVGGKFQSLELPQTYNDKADAVIKEVLDAKEKAFAAQQQAQLVKRSYKNKICKDNVKVTFMDNNEYKEICSDMKEIELFAKINKKVEKLSQEKIARLEHQRYEQSQIAEKQKRDQMLALEKERLAFIQKQYEEQKSSEAWRSFNQSLQQLNNSLERRQQASQQRYYQMQEQQQRQDLNDQLKKINNSLNGLRFGY